MQNMFHMIDVGDKPMTKRTAIASGKIIVSKHAFDLIKAKALPKGDALVIAEIAGINGAKRAYETIFLCHPLALDHVEIRSELDEKNSSITIYCIASAIAKTGVEMEAIAGVNAALITIYDLTKMVEPALIISDIKLLVKIGGKSGLWINPEGAPKWAVALVSPHQVYLDKPRTAVITLSDRAANKEYEDQSGVLLCELLKNADADIVDYAILPDDKEALQKKILELCKKQTCLIITTGGTGISSRDYTTEALTEICDRIIPGIGELLRINGAQYTGNSWSSRSIAGIIDKTIIIALPGKPKAIEESMRVLLPVLQHLLDTIEDKKHD